MSLITEILISAIGKSNSSEETENQSQNLMNGALVLLQSMGGVDGLLKKFQQSGLGDLAASWVGTGENKSILPDQLTSVVGKDQVAALAKEAGISESQVATVLSHFVPTMVDKLTPEGKAPESNNLDTWKKLLMQITST